MLSGSEGWSVRSAPAYARAVALLEQIVAECRRSGERHLPRLRELASMAQVSQVTMVKAVRELAKRGIVVARRGSGLTVRDIVPPQFSLSAAAWSPPPTVAGSLPRWQSVKNRLSADLVSRVFSPGMQLPCAKTLCEAYGTSHANLRRALCALVEERRLEPYKRGYRVAGPRPPSSRATLAMVATMDVRGILTHLGPRAPSFWRHIEEECGRRGLTLEIYDYLKSVGAFPWPDGVRQRLVDRIDAGRQLGFLVWSFAMDARALSSVMGMLAEVRLPVSVLCETWESTIEEYAEVVGRVPGAKLFAVAMTGRCGERMGEYLLALGHRRVAVFCQDRITSGWLRRFEGIVRAYERAGLPGSCVIPYGPSESLTAQVRQETALVERYRRLSERILARLRDTLTDLFQANGLNPFVFARWLQSSMAPAFEQALSDCSCTAWVGLSDLSARMALYFLRGRGVQIPEDISVTGFDNDSESFADGLTTYDFNMGGVVQAMIEHVLTHRQGPKAGSGAQWVEIEGCVVTRQSAGPARRG